MNIMDYNKLTIYEVEAFYKTLVQLCTEATENVVLDFVHLRKIDMAGIQLLLSAQKSCEKRGVVLILKNVSSDINDMICISGCGMLLGGVE